MLAQSPQRIVLRFSEPPDPRLSSAGLLDAAGRPVPGASPARAVPGTPAELVVDLGRPLSLLGGAALSLLVPATRAPAGACALLHTSFGVTLLVKVGPVVVLVALGVRNRFRLVPALARDPGAGAGFGRTARAELAVAAAVLAASAVLAGLAPAGPATLAAPARHAVVRSASDVPPTVTVHLTVSPTVAGEDSFMLVTDRYGSTTPAAARSVTPELTLPSHVGLGASLALRRGPAGSGAWTGRGLQLSLPGVWRVEAVIVRAGAAVVIPLMVPVAAS